MVKIKKPTILGKLGGLSGVNIVSLTLQIRLPSFPATIIRVAYVGSKIQLFFMYANFFSLVCFSLLRSKLQRLCLTLFNINNSLTMRKVKYLPEDSQELDFDRALEGHYIGMIQDFEIINQEVIPVTYFAIEDINGQVQAIPPRFIKFMKNPMEEVFFILKEHGVDEQLITQLSNKFA